MISKMCGTSPTKQRKKLKLEQTIMTTDKMPGQGTPNSANTQGNETPNP